MFFLLALIHSIFLTLFFILGRYVEWGVIALIFLVFFIKIIPPIDVFKKPKFLKKEVSGKESLYQSIHFSSWVLFYLALVGISISASNYFDLSNNLILFQYCIFFLTSTIYALYLIFYTKSPGIITIFRIHCIITGLFLTVVSVALVVLWKNIIWFMLLNSILILFGLLAVLVLDRDIPYGTYLTALYIFWGLVFSESAAFISMISFFQHHQFLYFLFFSIFLLAGLYIFLPQFLRRSLAVDYTPQAVWHTRNTLLLLSWVLFGILVWLLFWGLSAMKGLLIASLILLLVFWSWVYIHNERSPIFFAGNILVLTTLYAYVFFYKLPPTFWLLLVCLFLFIGILLLFARYFYDKNEELMLAINAVLFMCIADFYFLFSGHYGLFELSMLFFLQSFLWYGVYEIFHRHSNAKITTL